MKGLFIFLSIYFFVTTANASILVANNDSIKFERKNLAISVGFGFPEYSLSLNYQLNNQLSARLSYLIGSYQPNYYTSFKGNYTEVKGDFDFNMFNLFFDYYPSKNNTFRISLGLARCNNNLSLTVTPLTDQSFGYITYTPSDIGKIKTEILVNSIMPYLGIGLGKAVPTNRLGLGLDIGLYYQGSPKFNFQSDGSFKPSNNDFNRILFENSFSNWVFIPSINLQIKYKILPR